MMTARKEYDLGLQELQDLLVQMGGQVEQALQDAITALAKKDIETAKRIIAEDVKLNALEEQINIKGATLIATQQPVAKDLRTILSAFRIAADLERMADLSVDIAKTTLRLEGEALIKPLVDLPRMAEITQLMIYESIQAFIHEDVDLAYKIGKDDDKVDLLFSQIFSELFNLTSAKPEIASQAMMLSFVGRYIERIADHATNIGESVVYLVTGVRPDLNV